MIAAFCLVITACSSAPEDSVDACSDRERSSRPSSLPQACSSTPDATCGTETPFITVTHLGVATGLGFNIDGINNAQRGGAGGGSNATIEGCGKVDLKYGLDDALETLSPALQPVLDLDAALASSLRPNGGDGLLEFRFSNVVRADAARDDCMRVELRVGGEGGTVIAGSGSMIDHVASVWFGSSLRWVVTPTTSPESCTGDVCTEGAELEFVFDYLSATLRFDETNSFLEPGSTLGGFVFAADPLPEYAEANADGFTAAFARFADEANLDEDARGDARQAIDDARDLRIDADGTPGFCSSPTNNLNSTNRNALSFALSLDSR